MFELYFFSLSYYCIHNYTIQLSHFSLIRETLQKLRSDLQMDSRTIQCLQEASEQIIVQYIQDICSIPDPPQTLAEARMKCMVMNFYTNYFRNNK